MNVKKLVINGKYEIQNNEGKKKYNGVYFGRIDNEDYFLIQIKRGEHDNLLEAKIFLKENNCKELNDRFTTKSLKKFGEKFFPKFSFYKKQEDDIIVLNLKEKLKRIVNS